MSRISIQRAAKIYQLSLVKKSFSKLKTIWFEERAQWRLLLRASVHYYTKLKFDTFSRWKYYAIKQKQKRIKREIGDYFYTTRLKRKCFLYLRHLPSFNAKERLVLQNAVTYKIFSYLYAHILSIHRNYFLINFENYINIWHWCSFKKRVFKYYFRKLQMYAKNQKVKRHRYRLLKLYRQEKYNPKILNGAMRSWINFTHVSTIKRTKLNVANRHSDKKLKAKCFANLHSYTVRRGHKNAQKLSSALFYEKVLLRKYFKYLMTYKDVRKMKRCQTECAFEFFTRKIRRRCLERLIKYKNRKQRNRGVYNAVVGMSKRKTKAKCFKILQNYRKRKLMKTIQYEETCRFHARMLKKKAFQILKSYAKYKIVKVKVRKDFSLRIGKVVKLLTLRMNFDKWLAHRTITEQKKLKRELANKCYRKSVTLKAMRCWKQFLTRKKSTRKNIQRAESAYKLKMQQKAIDKFKIYIREQKELQINLDAVNDFNKKLMLRAGIRIILTSAFRLYDGKVKLASHKFYRKYHLASKYFRIWKRRLSITVRPKSRYEYVPFQWNPICFEKPKIPKYLQVLINE